MINETGTKISHPKPHDATAGHPDSRHLCAAVPSRSAHLRSSPAMGSDAPPGLRGNVSVLAGEQLPGKIDSTTPIDPNDFRYNSPRFSPQARAANYPVVELLNQVAQRKKASAPQIALAWLLAQKPWVVPIPGTTQRERLTENLGAVTIDLTPDDLREIDAAASKIDVQGARLPEAVLRYSNR